MNIAIRFGGFVCLFVLSFDTSNVRAWLSLLRALFTDVCLSEYRVIMILFLLRIISILGK